MGEIDTKPIEPVQVAITLFDEKGDQKKQRSSSSGSCEETEKEKDVDVLLKELANNKVQLEAKDSACLQLLHNLANYQKEIEELSILLKECEAARDARIEECREARSRIDELECKLKEMTDQLSETVKIREQLSHVLGELKAAQGELLSMETELVAAREAQVKALQQADIMEAAANMEKERAEELLRHVPELNETILKLKLEVAEAEKEKCVVLCEKDVQLELATERAAEAQEEIDYMRKRLEGMQELENLLLTKSEVVETLQVELRRVKELLCSSNKAVSDVTEDLNKLKEDLKGKEIENSDQAIYIGVLDSEVNQLRSEMKAAKDEVTRLSCNVEMLKDELEKVKDEMERSKEKENEAQVEIALLKAEVHKGRSELAAAKAAEARAAKLKLDLKLAVQELAAEKDDQTLKQAIDTVAEESDDTILVGTQFGQCSQPREASSEEVEETSNVNGGNFVTIPIEEYESLVRKAEKLDQSPGKDSNNSTTSQNKHEVEALKKDLEAATARITDFRTRAEQAITRAEAAERAKLALEGQLRKWREHRQRKKAAIAALREETSSREYIAPTYEEDSRPKNYQPLAKILNMEF
ncbi:hypothetical protein Tsubulata_015027 [Turnera subulata]|uniref:WEB family protein n=1 Tax=Turnera subulata TaxID=218843 RepID=A0A9Q0J193_9ROSI|nr:hypothetical protein Tsubulata_015027 [Turnera subulata]